jgi:hypothetical protein
MRCSHCHDVMLTTERVSEGSVSQTWYHCACCGRDQTVVRPQQPFLRRLGNKRRCSSVWPEVAGAGA